MIWQVITGSNKVALTLTKMGFSVLLTGRRYRSTSPLKTRPYPTHRMYLLFRKGAIFYAAFNIRLFLFLLFHRFDLLLSNDLDTLPANFLAAKLKRKPLVYDSHEYFTEVSELIGRPRVRKFWGWLERMMVPKVDAAYTVSSSIADVYSRRYKIPFEVVSELFPLRYIPSEIYHDRKTEDSRRVIIYQGVLNKGRGIEQAITAMQYLSNVVLLLAGSGDIEQELRELATRLKLENVRFAGRLPLEELLQLTRQAHLGISIEEDLGLNYRFALPNKLFDYIQAVIPVVVSNLPEMSKIVNHYKIGLVTPSLEPEILASIFNEALTNEDLRQEWRLNLQKAAMELTWENEEKKVRNIFDKFLFETVNSRERIPRCSAAG